MDRFVVRCRPRSRSEVSGLADGPSASALLCVLFFLMAYVYYGLVLLQPLLVRFAEKADDDDPARHCDAADVSAVDFAGNIVAAAGELPARF